MTDMEKPPAGRDELLTTGCRRLGLSPCGDTVRRLLSYCDEIELWNRKTSMVAASGTELVIKHVLDSLAACSVLHGLLKPGDTLADLGSGAGLPGIPLAMFLPGVKVELIERSGKRAVFLKNAAAILGLGRLEVKTADYRNISAEYRVVTFRALNALDEMFIRAAARLLSADGWVAAYKGRRVRIDEELIPVRDLIENLQIIELDVPYLNEERHLVLFKPAHRCQSG